MTSQTVWWTWTASATGPLAVAVTTHNDFPIVGVFTGAALPDLVEVSTFSFSGSSYSIPVSFTSQARFEAIEGTTYAIAVDAGDQTFDLAITAPPIVSLISPVAGTNFAAGSDIVVEARASDPDGTVRRVVYMAKGNSRIQGLIGIVTNNSPFPFNWTNVPAGLYTLTAQAWDNFEASTVSDPVSISVGRPANDNFMNRFSLTGSSLTIHGSNLAATREPGEPDHAGNQGQHSLWWSWSPPASSNYVVSTKGSSFTTLLGVYLGASLSTLTEVTSDLYGGGDQTSRLNFDASAGKKYQIAVDGLGDASGDVVLNIYPTPPPPNDNFLNRIILTGSPGTIQGNSFNASGEPGEPGHFGSPAVRSVWWTWVAPASGPVTLDTTGSTFDTILAVYTGNELSELSLLGIDDDGGGDLSSRLNFTAIANTAYHIVVDGFQGAAGDIWMNLNFTPTPVQLSNRSMDQGQFALLLCGAEGQRVVIEASTDLQYWVPISTNMILNGMIMFVDMNSTNFTQRFYRAALDFSPVPFAITTWKVEDGQFMLQLTGTEGDRITIEASADLQNWTPISTNTVIGGTVTFSDSDSTRLNQRFYRAARQ